MTNAELHKIIIDQRKYYGEALQRLSEILEQANLEDYAQIALRFKENYGLEDGLAIANGNGHPTILSVKLDKHTLIDEISRILRKSPDSFSDASEIRSQLTEGEFTDSSWTAALKQLFKEGKIDVRGSYAHKKYRWIENA